MPADISIETGFPKSASLPLLSGLEGRGEKSEGWQEGEEKGLEGGKQEDPFDIWEDWEFLFQLWILGFTFGLDYCTR